MDAWCACIGFFYVVDRSIILCPSCLFLVLAWRVDRISSSREAIRRSCLAIRSFFLSLFVKWYIWDIELFFLYVMIGTNLTLMILAVWQKMHSSRVCGELTKSYVNNVINPLPRILVSVFPLRERPHSLSNSTTSYIYIYIFVLLFPPLFDHLYPNL